MARMIPDRFDEGTSAAERRVFGRLQSDPDTEGWTVLHSLALSRRGHKPYGEIDFVILVPGAGIVCLEVKGGRVSCANGIWRTQNQFGQESELRRSPFQQSREGMFALRSRLQAHFREGDAAANALLASAVAFPDVIRPPQTTEFEPWECIDIERLRHPISKPILEVLRFQKEKLGPATLVPDAETLRRIRVVLRPDFDIVVARATTIARSEERLLSLTEEQYETIDSLRRNARCLVEGAAGTGKTMLALEYARRSVAEGSRTLLLCFNRLLGTWISEQAAGLSPGGLLVAGSYHRVLRELIVKSPLREDFLLREASEEPVVMFNQIYPSYGELVLSEAENLPDLIILDEAQDLAQEGVLCLLNAWLSGGLAGGRWAMFGDFTRQAIYSNWESSNDVSGSESGVSRFEPLLQAHAPHHATLILRRNCRNTRHIGEETALLSGFDSLPYRLNDGESLPVDYRWWRSRESQVDLLRGALASLQSEGVNTNDILVLSPLRFENSVVSSLKDDSKHPVMPLELSHEVRRRGAKPVHYSTIQAFKGMESPVVILCDIDRMSSSGAQALLYVGMSRARSHLIALLDERLRPEVQIAVQRRLMRGWAA